jgi:DegV family protein with EDD domain
MNEIAIMTDTISYIPQDLANEYDIKILPMNVQIEGKNYLENEVDLVKYYDDFPRWKEEGKLPTTSGVPIGTFLHAYHDLSKEAKAIIFIGHSNKLGMTVNVAMQAKEQAKTELPGTHIEVIDSLTACGAQTLVVLEAARAVAAGQDLSQVISLCNDTVRKVKLIVLYDDLYYIARSGRIARGRAWASSKISNTAIMEMDASTGGEHKPIARCKTKGQTLATLFDIVGKESAGKRLHVILNHSNMPLEAEELKEKMLSQFSCAEMHVTQIGPVVTAHIGLGVRLINWWSEE